MSLENERPSLDSLFEAALELKSSAERSAYLEQACRGDQALRAEVESLLQADREMGSFLDGVVVPKLLQDGNGVLAALGANIDDVPSVMLRDDGEEPILKPSSLEIPKEQNTSRYQLMGEIARGGMGAIIRGHDSDLGRDLALKVLLDEHKDNPDYVRRFVEEAQISGQLQHPGITPVFELGQFGDQRPYFSMKLVKGQTFAAILDAREVASDDRGKLLGVFEQICQTMAYAHSRGVIHRDLKPANVMVGNFGEVQVMDWGLAKVLGAGDRGAEQRSVRKQTGRPIVRASSISVGDVENGSDLDTRFGSVMGTFAYMPPEQALGKVDRLDERADVFALGAILCEILTGKPAYVAEERTDLRRMATAGELDGCLSRLDACQAEAELVEIAKACLALELNQRLRNAGVVAEKLAHFQDSLEKRLRDAELEKAASDAKATEERRRRQIYVWICLLLACVGMAAIFVAGRIQSLYLEKSELVAEVEQQRNRADQELYLGRVSLLANSSRVQRTAKPETSVLLALEAGKLSRKDTRQMPIAHEALLNSTQSLGGMPLRGHSEVTAMQISEQRLVTLAGGLVRIFDLTVAEPHLSPQQLGSETAPIRHIAMNDDGRWLITVGNSLQRWDLEARNPEPQTVHEGTEIVSVALSANGRWVVAQDQSGVIRRWECEKDSKSTRILDHDSQVWDQVLISSLGRWVVLQKGQSSCRLLDVGTETVERIDLEARAGLVFKTKMSNDGRWLAVGDRHGVRLFDLHAQNVVESAIALPAGTVHPAAIKGLEFSQDSSRLFGWHSQFPWVRRWNLHSPNESPHVVEVDDGGVRSLAFTDDGQTFAFGSVSGTVEMFGLSDDESLEMRDSFKVHDWPVRSIALHPQGRWMATADWDRSVRLWDLTVAHPMSSPFVLKGQDDLPRTPMATSSDGRWIASVLANNAIELWDTSSPGELPRAMSGHQEFVRSICFADQDRWMVTHSRIPEAGSVRIWDLSNPNPSDDVIELPGISSVAAAYNYQKLAAVYLDDTVRLVDLHDDDPAGSAQIIGTHEIDSEFALGRMAISPDANWLVTACQTTSPTADVRIYVWNLRADDIADSCQILNGKKQYMHGNGLVIDPTSRWLVTAGGFSVNEESDEDTVTIWDLHAQDIAASARTIKQKGDVWQVAVSPNCDWMFTARMNGQVQLWDLRNGVTPQRLLHCGQSAAISRDGRWLAAGGRAQFNTFLFDLEADEPWKSARVLRGHTAPVWALAFSDDSRWLVTDSSDGTVRRWCMDTQRLIEYAADVVGRELTQEERNGYGVNGAGVTSGQLNGTDATTEN